jgi:hypothetical protein
MATPAKAWTGDGYDAVRSPVTNPFGRMYCETPGMGTSQPRSNSKRAWKLARSEELNARAEAVARETLRGTALKIHRRIHDVTTHEADQPRLKPVFALGESTP